MLVSMQWQASLADFCKAHSCWVRLRDFDAVVGCFLFWGGVGVGTGIGYTMFWSDGNPNHRVLLHKLLQANEIVLE